jgi:hypothetical protein
MQLTVLGGCGAWPEADHVAVAVPGLSLNIR